MHHVSKYWELEEGYRTYYDDSGFCAYSCVSGEFYIAHFYVEKGRSSYKFFDKIKKIAKELGATHLSGNIDLNEANKENYTNKVLIQLKHGYKIVDVTDKRITVIYELD